MKVPDGSAPVPGCSVVFARRFPSMSVHALLCFSVVWTACLAGGKAPQFHTYEPPYLQGLCDAQCEALCLEMESDTCEGICTNYTSREWELNCDDSGYCDLGYCSILEGQGQGYVPPLPNVTIERDVVASVLTLRWPRPNTRHKIIYVVQGLSSTVPPVWLLMGWVNTTSFSIPERDVCFSPVFRVAAVSRYGSRWFSPDIHSPIPRPGPVTAIEVQSMRYVKMDLEVYIDLAWQQPAYWRNADIAAYRWSSTVQEVCGSQHMHPASVKFGQPYGQTQVYDGTRLTIRVSEAAIGCNLTFQVRAWSRCSENSEGVARNYTIKLDKHSINGYMPPKEPVVYPGPVKDVRTSVRPSSKGPVVDVSWSPPDDPGSAGYVDSYIVNWGKLHRDVVFYITDTQNFTVPGTNTSAKIQLSKGIIDPIGVQIKALAPGEHVTSMVQSVTEVSGLERVGDPEVNGKVVFDDDEVVVVHVPYTNSVRVYWELTRSKKREVTGYGIQWGHVGNDALRVHETKIVAENETFVEFSDLRPKQKYGLKVAALYENTTLTMEDWDNLTLHEFELPELEPSPTSLIQMITNRKDTKLIAAVSSSLLGMLALAVVAIVCLVRKRKQRLKHLDQRLHQPSDSRYYFYHEINPNFSPSHLASPPVVPDKWELPLSCLKFGEVLGSGAFGQVYRGLVTSSLLQHRGVSVPETSVGSGIYVTVAVKLLQENCEARYVQDFLKEINLMKEIGYHRNLVSMLGCCTLRQPICLVVEHASQGDLLHYLKTCRHGFSQAGDDDGARMESGLTLIDLFFFARQIAIGMEFLSEKGFVHRDLAARNIMVCGDRTIKIGDFGLARYIYNDKVYVNRRGGKLPIKWMSIEAIFDMTFSSASDVWSLGVVLFELVTLGGAPYPTFSCRELLRALKQGYRMEQPDNCPDELYQVMIRCWDEVPARRPSFSQLREEMESLLETHSSHTYLQLSIDEQKDYYQVSDGDLTGDSMEMDSSDYERSVNEDPPSSRDQQTSRVEETASSGPEHSTVDVDGPVVEWNVNLDTASQSQAVTPGDGQTTLNDGYEIAVVLSGDELVPSSLEAQSLSGLHGNALRDVSASDISNIPSRKTDEHGMHSLSSQRDSCTLDLSPTSLTSPPCCAQRAVSGYMDMTLNAAAPSPESSNTLNARSLFPKPMEDPCTSSSSSCASENADLSSLSPESANGDLTHAEDESSGQDVEDSSPDEVFIVSRCPTLSHPVSSMFTFDPDDVLNNSSAVPRGRAAQSSESPWKTGSSHSSSMLLSPGWGRVGPTLSSSSVDSALPASPAYLESRPRYTSVRAEGSFPSWPTWLSRRRRSGHGKTSFTPSLSSPRMPAFPDSEPRTESQDCDSSQL